MSLEQHSIDQGYKARLADLEVTPPAHAWAAIAAQLPNEKADEKGAWWFGSAAATAGLSPEEKSKRERVLFWWWTGALLTLATLSLLAYYGINTVNTNNSNLNPTPKPSAAALLPIAVIDNAERGFITAQEKEDCPEVITKNNVNSSAVAAVVAITTTSKNVKPAKSKATPSTRVQSTNAGGHSEAGNLEANDRQQELISTTTTTTSNPTIQELKRTPLLPDTKTSTPISSSNLVGLSLASTSIDKLPFANLSLLKTAATKLPFSPGIGCEDFKNSASWSFAVRAFAGPGMIFQEYSATDATAAYKGIRDSVETQQMSVHGGLRFEAVNDRGLFVRAGVDYQMYRLNNQFLGPRSSRTVIDSIFMEDTQTWRIESTNVSVQEQRTVYNRQHAVVFTGGVGFRKTFGNVSPYIMAEAGYEILFKRKGLFVLPNETVADLAEDDQGLYINDRPGFQYGGVIGVDFALTDRIELGLSGHYKQLGGLRGSADLLDYNQSTAFGALNLRYTIQ